MTVTDNGDGTLSVTNDAGTRIVFTNEYNASGKTQFGGEKVLNGRALAPGEFTFELYEGTDTTVAPLDTKSNDADGKFMFDELSYDQTDAGKTYTYTVKEVKGDLGGVTYSTQSYTVTVTVTDNGDGTLNVTNDAGTRIVFTNTYKGSGDVVIEGEKSLTGRALAAGEFSFELYEGETLKETVKNGADGTFKFTKIDYDETDIDKTYTYTVKEVKGELGGVTYSEVVYTVTVKVEYDGDEILKVTKLVDGSAETAIVFENVYKASGDITLRATKSLTGRALADGEFSFQLLDSEDNVLQTKKNDLDGNIVFDALSYTEADAGKTYNYTVKEVKGELGGVDYDATEYAVAITVTDNGDGTLTVTKTVNGSEETAIAFSNTYKAEGEIVLTAVKTLTGERDLAAGEFTFTLTGEGENQSKTNAADGTVTFDAIKYDETDVGKTYTYTITEDPGTIDGVVYDVASYTVAVSIADNGDGTLAVTSTVNGDADGKIEFNNPYVTLTVSGAKTWDDEDDRDGVRPESITVRLFADGTEIDSAVVTPAEDGTWSFSFPGLPKYKPGTKTDEMIPGNEIVYTISEDAVSGYTTTISQSSYSVVNRHDPAKTTITVVKNWDDEDYYGLRVGVTATITLYKSVEGVTTEVDTVTVGHEQGWSHTWTDLYVYEDGKLITYGVKETLEVANSYESDTLELTTVANDGSITITNTHRELPPPPTPTPTPTPPPPPAETVDVTVEKVWQDNDNEDGQRPDSVTVILVCNGTETANTAELSESNGWKYTWTGLDKYDADGNAYIYTVKEDVPAGYTVSYGGNAESGFAVINTKDSEFEDEEPPLYGENIVDEEPPLYGPPLTGDESHIPFWAGISGLALAGLIVTLTGRKKKEDEE